MGRPAESKTESASQGEELWLEDGINEVRCAKRENIGFSAGARMF
jgi:hypothetical protein